MVKCGGVPRDNTWRTFMFCFYKGSSRHFREDGNLEGATLFFCRCVASLATTKQKGDAAMSAVQFCSVKFIIALTVAVGSVNMALAAEEHSHIPWTNQGLDVRRSDQEKSIDVRRSDAERSIDQRRSDQEGRSPHEKAIDVRRSDAERSIDQRRSDQEGRSPHEKQISTQRSPCEGMWHSGSDFKR